MPIQTIKPDCQADFQLDREGEVLMIRSYGDIDSLDFEARAVVFNGIITGLPDIL